MIKESLLCGLHSFGALARLWESGGQGLPAALVAQEEHGKWTWPWPVCPPGLAREGESTKHGTSSTSITQEKPSWSLTPQ